MGKEKQLSEFMKLMQHRSISEEMLYVLDCKGFKSKNCVVHPSYKFALVLLENYKVDGRLAVKIEYLEAKLGEFKDNVIAVVAECKAINVIDKTNHVHFCRRDVDSMEKLGRVMAATSIIAMRKAILHAVPEAFWKPALDKIAKNLGVWEEQ